MREISPSINLSVDEYLEYMKEDKPDFYIIVEKIRQEKRLGTRPFPSTKLNHSWVRVGKEVIDGNVDVLFENPMVPSTINIRPYWGLINNTPNDRKLIENKSVFLPQDDDVDSIWWPELQKWIKEKIE